MAAAAKARLEAVQLLHQRGALPGNTAPSAARSPVASRLGVLRFLLHIGAPIDAIEFQHNPKGYASDFNVGSALNLACCWTSKSSNNEGEAMVEMLLARGARTNVPDFSGRTALDLAREYGTERMVELIQHSKNRANA
jgi:ankyrin repeat protein